MEKRQYRQGDLLIERCKMRSTETLTEIERVSGRLILAHGEATGHAHAIRSPKASLFAAAGRVFLAVDGDCVALEHEEHLGDEPLVMVEVVNSTPERDGTMKHYFLRVHPELRPLLGDQQLGDPQELTARNAVASTFGRRGEEYSPLVET